MKKIFMWLWYLCGMVNLMRNQDMFDDLDKEADSMCDALEYEKTFRNVGAVKASLVGMASFVISLLLILLGPIPNIINTWYAFRLDKKES